MKNKRNGIIWVIVFLIFCMWVVVGPSIIAHFREQNEVVLNSIDVGVDVDKNINETITYAIDKINYNASSYREVIELEGYAFKELNEEIKKREIDIVLISDKKIYTAQAQMMLRPELAQVFEPKLDSSKVYTAAFYTKFSGITIKNGSYKVALLVKEDDKEYLTYTKYKLDKEAGKIVIFEDITTNKKVPEERTLEVSEYNQAIGSLDILINKGNMTMYAYGWAINDLKNTQNRTTRLLLKSDEKEYVIPCKLIYRYGLVEVLDKEIDEKTVISLAFETLFDLRDVADGEYKVYIEVDEDGNKFIMDSNKMVTKQKVEVVVK